MLYSRNLTQYCKAITLQLKEKKKDVDPTRAQT